MTRGDLLYRLQILDREADAKRVSLAQVEIDLDDTDALERASTRLAQATERANKCVGAQTSLELELQGLVDRIARDEKRLYSGAIKNPKELQELQQEVASLRRRESRLEDSLLAAMIETDEAQASRDEAGDLLERERADHKARTADLQSQRTTLTQRLADLGAERANLLPEILKEDLGAYESLRRRKGGLAVAPVRSNACTACGVTVSVNRRWHLREGDLVTCSNCERIIVLA
jgi:predicted  nucleic acid-binding Zn-ribbon protein